MKPISRLPRLFPFLALVLLALGGCGAASPPVSFYALSPLPPPEVSPRIELQDRAIGLVLQTFPEALDRPQIVTVSGRHRLQFAETHRWGGTLQGDVLRVVTENLSARLGSARVAPFPWPGYFTPEVRVLIEVLRFDGRLDQAACLKARWTIADGSGRTALQRGEAAIEAPVAAAGYEALVAAQSQALAVLSGRIAAQILEASSALPDRQGPRPEQ